MPMKWEWRWQTKADLEAVIQEIASLGVQMIQCALGGGGCFLHISHITAHLSNRRWQQQAEEVWIMGRERLFFHWLCNSTLKWYYAGQGLCRIILQNELAAMDHNKQTSHEEFLITQNTKNAKKAQNQSWEYVVQFNPEAANYGSPLQIVPTVIIINGARKTRVLTGCIPIV